MQILKFQQVLFKIVNVFLFHFVNGEDKVALNLDWTYTKMGFAEARNQVELKSSICVGG